MKQLNDNDFAVVCFLVLMDNGEGILEKHPRYIFEKLSMIYDGEEAFGKLDIYNMEKVVKWHENFHVAMPPRALDYYLKCQSAAKEMEDRGFKL